MPYLKYKVRDANNWRKVCKDQWKIFYGVERFEEWQRAKIAHKFWCARLNQCRQKLVRARADSDRILRLIAHQRITYLEFKVDVFANDNLRLQVYNVQLKKLVNKISEEWAIEQGLGGWFKSEFPEVEGA